MKTDIANQNYATIYLTWYCRKFKIKKLVKKYLNFYVIFIFCNTEMFLYFPVKLVLIILGRVTQCSILGDLNLFQRVIRMEYMGNTSSIFSRNFEPDYSKLSVAQFNHLKTICCYEFVQKSPTIISNRTPLLKIF